MAITVFKALWAFGHKTTLFLQSLFLFPFHAIPQAFGLFPSFRQTNQPTLPFSNSRSASPSSSETQQTEDEMPNAASSSAALEPHVHKASSVSKTAPAPPHTAPPGKENRVVEEKASDDTELCDQFSALEIDKTGKTATASQDPLQDTVNGTGSGIAEDGTGRKIVQDLAEDGTAESAVTRALPVPLTHPVSQTSKPKEAAAATTTIQLDGVTVQVQAKAETPEQAAEKATHSRFMREALDMARLALKTNETPVGCVLVYKDRVIARGMNATNVTRNGTRHAELMAISALLSYSPASDLEKVAPTRMPLGDKTNVAQAAEETSTWGDVDPKDGHLYPYGQKLHPSPRVDASVITECTLYVTVEPCVMCASLLRQLKVKKVFFGAVNDKFGGTGGVFRIHKNSPFSMASAPPSPAPQNGKGIARPVLERRPATTDAVAEEHSLVEEANDECNMVVSPIADTSALPGDGGNIERGYEAEGGWGRDEAVTLLRQFYVQENNRAPVPRKKEGRAARLAAMMERDGNPAAASDDANAAKSQDESGATTPAVQETAAEATAENGDEAAEPLVAVVPAEATAA